MPDTLLGNARIDIEQLYGLLVLCALQNLQKPGRCLHQALETRMLWNLFCVVVLSAVFHGRAVSLLWITLEHPSASVSDEVCITLLDRADLFLAEFTAIPLLADRAFPSAELLGWFETKLRWQYVMRLRGHSSHTPILIHLPKETCSLPAVRSARPSRP